jgi:hypothetical protein
VVLIDEHLTPDVDEWLEAWLDFRTGVIRANTAGRSSPSTARLGVVVKVRVDWRRLNEYLRFADATSRRAGSLHTRVSQKHGSTFGFHG